MYTVIPAFLLAFLVSPSSDSMPYHPRRVTTLDSARITSPAYGTVLANDTVTLTIQPLCSTASAALFVRFYPRKTDTLARLSRPPFSARWNCSGLPDQDQMHLQFGYVLHHVNGDTIVSPPLPHRWVIDRRRGYSKKRQICRHVAPGDSIAVDGELSEWKRYPHAALGTGSWFRCAWNPAAFYIAVSVSDSLVDSHDRVEVMFDLLCDRASFAGITHRILSFSPRGRHFVWAVDRTHREPMTSDSIVIRVEEEMAWQSRLTARGYVIEAAIPFCVLSSLEFPPKRFGFDVAVVRSPRHAGRTPGAVSWSSAPPAARHNPSEWGICTLHQLMRPLKMTFVALIMLGSGLIVLILTLIYYQHRKDRHYERHMKKCCSPMVSGALEAIEHHAGDSSFSLDTLSSITGCSRQKLATALHEEAGAPFDALLDQSRIRRAKRLLRDTDTPLEDIAASCGYDEPAAFQTVFSRIVGVEPETFRKTRREEQREEEEGS